MMMPVLAEWWLRPVSKGCAGGRAQRSRVELGVAKTVLRESVEGRRRYRPTESAAGAEADIVRQN